MNEDQFCRWLATLQEQAAAQAAGIAAMVAALAPAPSSGPSVKQRVEHLAAVIENGNLAGCNYVAAAAVVARAQAIIDEIDRRFP